MKFTTLVLASLLVTGTAFARQTIELPGGPDTQAMASVLSNALNCEMDRDQSSGYPHGKIQSTSSGLTLRDGRSRLVCWSETLGQLQVQSTRCVLEMP